MIHKEIQDNEIKAHLASIHPNEMTGFVMAEGLYRGALFNATHVVNQMAAQWNHRPLETMILAQAYIAAALLIPSMKGKEQVQLRYDTEGPAAGFCVEADSTGFVRGYLLQDHIPIEKPLESWDLTPFFGEGRLKVTRFPEASKEAFTGIVEIKYKNIAQDLAWYFAQSEQINTAINISVQFDNKGRIVGAGGFFLQALPHIGGKLKPSLAKELLLEKDGIYEASELLKDKVEHAFTSCPSLGQWYAEKGNNEDLIFGLFREFNPVIAYTRSINFECSCSKERLIDYVRNLGRQEIEELKAQKDHVIEITCHNCASVYKINKDEV
ncbi:MAG TPA: Hsp33 family molecular chaperone HslO [Treponemataceae bacterium]|nr:Hsp33 family molecular chaperone HslO [Treponemataceae bacterium]